MFEPENSNKSTKYPWIIGKGRQFLACVCKNIIR